MAKGRGKGAQSIVNDLADEYRGDAVRRIAEMSDALEKLTGEGIAPGSGGNESDFQVKLGVLKTHAHSLKGTSFTFGFSGLSVIANALDDFLNNHEPEDIVRHISEIERVLKLMGTVIRADEIVSESAARNLLSALDLTAISQVHQRSGEDAPTALLIMEQGENREKIVRLLEILDISILSARDGIEAIELATLQHPDVLLTVLQSDRLSAPELIEVFAEINATSTVPVIVMVPEAGDQHAGLGDHKPDIARDLLIGRLPEDVHIITLGEDMNRALADKLSELGVLPR